MLAEGPGGWAQAWSEPHSRSYGASEGRVQPPENQPGPR